LRERPSLIERDLVRRVSDLKGLGRAEENSFSKPCSHAGGDDERDLRLGRGENEAKGSDELFDARRRKESTHSETDRARARDDENAERVGNGVDDRRRGCPSLPESADENPDDEGDDGGDGSDGKDESRESICDVLEPRPRRLSLLDQTCDLGERVLVNELSNLNVEGSVEVEGSCDDGGSDLLEGGKRLARRGGLVDLSRA